MRRFVALVVGTLVLAPPAGAAPIVQEKGAAAAPHPVSFSASQPGKSHAAAATLIQAAGPASLWYRCRILSIDETALARLGVGVSPSSLVRHFAPSASPESSRPGTTPAQANSNTLEHSTFVLQTQVLDQLLHTMENDRLAQVLQAPLLGGAEGVAVNVGREETLAVPGIAPSGAFALLPGTWRETLVVQPQSGKSGTRRVSIRIARTFEPRAEGVALFQAQELETEVDLAFGSAALVAIANSCCVPPRGDETTTVPARLSPGTTWWCVTLLRPQSSAVRTAGAIAPSGREGEKPTLRR